MNSAIKLLLVFITITAFMIFWLTGQLGNSRNMMLIVVLTMVTVLAFFLLNLLENRERRRKRKERESISRPKNIQDNQDNKRSGVSHSLRERKAGLTWGGGNIKASTATRGTKRKFLGR